VAAAAVTVVITVLLPVVVSSPCWKDKITKIGIALTQFSYDSNLC